MRKRRPSCMSDTCTERTDEEQPFCSRCRRERRQPGGPDDLPRTKASFDDEPAPPRAEAMADEIAARAADRSCAEAQAEDVS